MAISRGCCALDAGRHRGWNAWQSTGGRRSASGYGRGYRLVDELQELLAGRRAQLLLVDRAVIVRVGGLELRRNDTCILFLIQRAVVVRVGSLDRGFVED